MRVMGTVPAAVQFHRLRCSSRSPPKLIAVVGPAPTQPVQPVGARRTPLRPTAGDRPGLGRAHRAPYATKYQWSYLHEALEVDGAHTTPDKVAGLIHSCSLIRQTQALQSKVYLLGDVGIFHRQTRPAIELPVNPPCAHSPPPSDPLARGSAMV